MPKGLAACMCLVLACVACLVTAAPAAAAKVTYTGEFESGVPADGIVAIRNERIRRIKTLNFGSPLEPLYVNCETSGEQTLNATANAMPVSRKREFADDGSSQIDGRFTRRGTMKGTFFYSATADFGSGPEHCESKAPETFKLVPAK